MMHGVPRSVGSHECLEDAAGARAFLKQASTTNHDRADNII